MCKEEFNMLKNYNGAVNRSVLRGLKKVSKSNAETSEYLYSVLNSYGEVSVYTNLCLTADCHEEYRTVILKSEADVKEYLKKDLEQRLENYLQEWRLKADFLLTAVISFLKENEGRYPNKEEMRQLEIAAENERIASAPLETKTEPPANWMILKEILELAEEIMETRWENNPKDFFALHPYTDRLNLSNKDCDITIEWRKVYRNNRDYSCEIGIDGYQIHLFYCNDTDPDLYVKNWGNKSVALEDVKDLNQYMIQVHQFIVEVAQREEIEFVSEVDYEKIV